ncbi:hypothetical protein LSH36_145g04064 [Paralvinella palmiformis]|uniref:RanBD1 domain-containing protein n=1 Tax=Paralvinella palmiformis TaxID=53620 RepID=A0AAD9N7C3_9ANNE|nr:hypothetical protein LSH36_145g04064 [Paralvinella palmiformis]
MLPEYVVTSEGGCLVGQKMDKCIKSPDSIGSGSDQAEGQANTEGGSCDSSRTDDGSQSQDGERPLLRPSAFNTTAGQGIVGGGTAVSNNPFAVRPGYSDSDDEKKEKPIVSPAHFTPGGSFGTPGFGFGSSGSSKLLLKPSALDKQTANFNKENSRSSEFRTSFKLEPAKLQNPFLKSDSDKDDSPEKVAEKTSDSTGTSVQQSLFGSVNTTDNMPVTNSKLEKNAFTPLTSSTSSQNTSFLFGQNMQNRVFGANSNSFTTNDGGFVFGQSLSDRVTSPKSNGTTAALSPTHEEVTTEAPTITTPEADKSVSLEESAAAHQARLARPEFEEVQVKTGEEDESNVFQINVKLFLFDKVNQSWIEKGRGQLRLNDMSCAQSRSFQSRLVMRTQGSLRVVLNTKVWAGMLVEMPSEKSVRITAVDHEDGIKIYLIMANRSDVSHIYSAINSRVQQLRAQEQKDKPTEAASTENTKEASQDEPAPQTHAEKRKSDTSSPEEQPSKRTKTRHNVKSEESNDSSTVDPETEASNESCTSSPTVKSSSSD